MMAEKTLKGFYDYADSELRMTLPKGTYCLTVVDFTVDQWDDGRLYIDLNTQVAEGDFSGRYGPRPRWTIMLEDFSGEAKDGREFTINAEEKRKTFIKNMGDILNGKSFQLTNHKSWDENMLNQIGQQVKGARFVAIVDEDPNGYARINKYFPISSPPKSFKGSPQKTFSVENV
jgi:hypothetical protein